MRGLRLIGGGATGSRRAVESVCLAEESRARAGQMPSFRTSSL